jgi:lysophospholipase L1-like esterase
MFSADNIQPPESFANACGLFIEDYIQAVRELADVWAVPVIDLASISGLYPMLDEHAKYFRNADTDRLHPNTEGHWRMAWAIAYQLLGYPADFPQH